MQQRSKATFKGIVLTCCIYIYPGHNPPLPPLHTHPHTHTLTHPKKNCLIKLPQHTHHNKTTAIILLQKISLSKPAQEDVTTVTLICELCKRNTLSQWVTNWPLLLRLLSQHFSPLPVLNSPSHPNEVFQLADKVVKAYRAPRQLL